ncbi:ferrous iron transport protein A [bacterium]|nr:ferrous iron transport protein A [bacterium]
MNGLISLVNMRSGQNGKIVQIDGGAGMNCRLDALGLRVGKTIKKVSRQLMRGPVIVSHGNTRAAVGFGMAQKIWVEIEQP